MHFHVELVRTTGSSSFTEKLTTWATRTEAQIMADRAQQFHTREGALQVSEPCNCPKPLEPESAARLLTTLQERVEAIESRQRAYGMHDLGCPGFHAQMQEKFNGRKIPSDCNCWLSKDA